MNRFLLSFSILLISFAVFAQNNTGYLLKIDLSEVSDLNVIEDLNLPVYHMFGDVLITVSDRNKLSYIEKLNVRFSVLDEFTGSPDYLLLTSKRNPEPGFSLMPEVLYENEGTVITKSINQIDQIVRSGYSVAPLINNNFSFRNERVINPESPLLSDTLINNVVSRINPDSVEFFIQSLQNFQTRFLFASTRDSVASWIKSQFLRFGFTDVQLDSFQYQGTWQTNVVATITGNMSPEKVFVFGGHHDSYSSGDPYTFAPGADDNASGTAAVLEAARVIMDAGYQPKTTIKFITFAAEEYGLWGSRHYGDYALSQGMNIRLMINHDMISHTYSSGANGPVDINRYTGSEAFGRLAFDMVDLYSTLTPYYGSNNSSGSDSYSFWQRGYKAVYFEEREFSPFYHSPQDIISNYNMHFCSEVIKSSSALLLTSVEMPDEVDEYHLFDTGTGSSLQMNWTSSSEPDFDHYKIYVGQSSGIYNITYTTNDTSYILTNLTEGINYFVAISVVNNGGYESFLKERNMVPRSIPLPPSDLAARPDWHSIELKWKKNSEIDLAGYNLYRSVDSSEIFEKLNTQLLSDTAFSDNSTSSGVKYFYYVKAQDSQMNESPKSNTVASRPVTLDRGILLVDATADGNGGLLNPTDQQVDEFYNSIISDFNKTDYDISAEGNIALMDLVSYSTVIWQKDDNQNVVYSEDIINIIKEYLDFGGNFLFSGNRPARLFGGSTGGGSSYQPGSFLYDYLKIDSSLYKNAARFWGALSVNSGYTDLFVDTMKTNSLLNYHILGIEGIIPVQSSMKIFSYETLFDSSSSFGAMKGEPVGLEYIGNDFNTVILSFPLYYMNQLETQLFINYVLTEKFGEVTGIEDEENTDEAVPSGFVLEQNYPNPFNPVTRIRWQSPVAGWHSIKVYDLLGREVAEVFSGYRLAGFHEVEFNGTELTSGIYFYKLQSGNFTSTKKMILLK